MFRSSHLRLDRPLADSPASAPNPSSMAQAELRDGFFGVGTHDLEFQAGPAPGPECDQIQQALAVGCAAVAENTNLGLESL